MRHAHAPRVKSRLEWQQGRTAEFESAVHVETLAEPQPPMLCRSFLGSPTASDVADSILRLQISTTCCQFSARKYTERRKFCCCCSWTGDAAKGGDGRTDDSSFIRLRRPWLCNRRRSPSFRRLLTATRDGPSADRRKQEPATTRPLTRRLLPRLR